MTVYRRWALEWRSDCRLDGKVRHLIGEPHLGMTRLFKTRREARDYREQNYGYFRSRPDLKAEPLGWQMPGGVRVDVTVEKVS